MLLSVFHRCSQWQVAGKNLKEGEKREGRRSGSKTSDCHRKKKEKKKKKGRKKKKNTTAYSGDILLLEYAWCSQMQTSEAHAQTETPNRLKIGQTQIYIYIPAGMKNNKLCNKISTVESVNGSRPVLQQRNVLKHKTRLGEPLGGQ